MNWENDILRNYRWCREISDEDVKVRRARAIVCRAENGQVIGVGTGSSSFIGLRELAKRIAEEGLRVTVIPAASEIVSACAALHVPTTTLMAARPDWCFDGADEIDGNGNVIKGRGAGLYQEKLIIASAPKRFLIAEDKKYVKRAGGVPIPVEVFPLALHLAEAGLRALGASDVQMRLAKAKDGAVVTENGNILLDCRFPELRAGLEQEIKCIPGVIESGLFQNYGFECPRV